VTIAVSDTGRGMERDFLRDRLFRPFDTTKGAAGMGMGRIKRGNTCARSGGTSMCKAVPGREPALRLPCRLS